MNMQALLGATTVLLVATAGFPPLSAVGQMAYYNQADLRNLFARVSASDYVVIAKLSKYESVGGRPSKEAVEEAQRKTDAARTPTGGVVYIPDDPNGGALVYKLDVTGVLCHQSDFYPRSGEQPQFGGPLYILVPSRHMGFDADFERFIPGKSYLVFLEKDLSIGQFSSLYMNVDTSRTYYRAHLRSRGAVELPPEAEMGKLSDDPAVRLLAGVKALCGAVKPADVTAKIANLTSLKRATDDPGLRLSARAAIDALKARGPTK